MAVVVAAIVYNFPAEPAGPEFYGIVAQIIPVLLVAIALDGRGQETWDRPHAAYRWHIAASLLAAEVVALLISAGTIEAGVVAAMICTVGLAGGFLAVSVIVLLVRGDVQTLAVHRDERARKRGTRRPRRRQPK